MYSKHGFGPQVTRLSLDEVGRLVVDLRTFAKFRGQFVMYHPGMEQVSSRLVAPDHLNLSLSLQLLWTAPTWDGPEQVSTGQLCCLLFF